MQNNKYNQIEISIIQFWDTLKEVFRYYFRRVKVKFARFLNSGIKNAKFQAYLVHYNLLKTNNSVKDAEYRLYKIYIDSINEYILNDTSNLALVLKGAWGSGKTHFVTTILEKHLPYLPNSVYPNEQIKWEHGLPKYEVLHISLNGITKVRQIHRRVAEKILSRSGVKRVFHSAFRFIGGWIGGKAKFDSKEINKISNGVSKLLTSGWEKRLLICFDDLERCKIDDIEEVLGEIHTSFIESNGVKVLIIGKISSDDLVAYRKIREKYIFREIDFLLPEKQMLELLIRGHSGLTKSTLYLLKKHEDMILELFIRSGTRNLRTLNYFIDLLNTLTNEILLKPSIKEADLTSVIHFLFTCSFLYKGGLVGVDTTAQAVKLLDDDFHYRTVVPSRERVAYLLQDLDTDADDAKQKPDPGVELYEKFIKGREFDYKSFPSLVVWIYDGIFDRKLIKREVFFAIKPRSNYVEAMKALSNFESYDESTLSMHVTKVFDGLQNGQYTFDEIPAIATNLEYMLNHDIIKKGVNLKQILSSAVSMSSKNISLETLDQVSDYYDPVQYKGLAAEIAEEIKSSLKTLREQVRTQKCFALFDKLFALESFKEEYKAVRNYPIFKVIEAEYFRGKLENATNNALNEFYNFLTARLLENSYEHLLEVEKENLLTIQGFLTTEQSDKVRKYIQNRIVALIEETYK